MLKKNYEKINTLIQMYEKKMEIHQRNLIEAFQNNNQESIIMNQTFIEALEGVVSDLRKYRLEFFSEPN